MYSSSITSPFLKKSVGEFRNQPLFFQSHPIYRDECGVFGIYNADEAAAYVSLGLHALQHRGQEATGIVSYEKPHFHSHRSLGLVGDTFSDADVIYRLKGRAALGHNRYSTTGPSTVDNLQPLFAELRIGGCALAHNGNLTNALSLRKQLIESGSVFSSSGDTEILLHLISLASGNVEKRLLTALKRVDGSFALVLLTKDKMIGVRDPWGIRPLVIGRLNGAYILASETCALNIIGADFVREVEQGEMVIFSTNEQGKTIIESRYLPNRQPYARVCLFEYVYFSRPDSTFAGRPIYNTRSAFGKELAREHPVQADLVAPIPDSGNPAAIGLAQELGIPFELGIVRNHYVGRTFIEPSPNIRSLGVRLKHSVNRDAIAGKHVILVDDSLVRGTTARKIVAMMREAGAKSVHLRIASPPVYYPCFYGINISYQDELAATEFTDQQAIAKKLHCDSLGYLSLDGLYRALGHEARDPSKPAFADHFFSGDYPTRCIDFKTGLDSLSPNNIIQNDKRKAKLLSLTTT